MQWIEDRVLMNFGRHAAPVIVTDQLKKDETYILLFGGFPNRRGFVPVSDWMAIHIDADTCEPCSRRDIKIDWNKLSNPGDVTINLEDYQAWLPIAVDLMEFNLREKSSTYKDQTRPVLEHHIEELEKKCETITEKLLGGENKQCLVTSNPEKLTKTQRCLLDELETTENNYKAAQDFVKDTYELESKPFIRVIGVLTGGSIKAPSQELMIKLATKYGIKF